LDAIAELKQWLVELTDLAGRNADFAFKWAERNGGIPETKEATDKLVSDFRQRFRLLAPEADQQAMRLIEDHYNAWAAEHGIVGVTPETLEQFDAETGMLTARIDEVSGFARPKELCGMIGARWAELASAAIALGCGDTTVAALKAAAALVPEIANGRAVLDSPTTWTQARFQANQLFQSEAIAGIPLNRAWDVALERLEQAAIEKISAGRASGGTDNPTNTGVDDLVNLDEAAAIVHRSKRTLERHLSKMPPPYVQGGGGKPSLWKWAELRIWLEKEFVPDLPKRFPRNIR
jgi:hypothetical protein